MRIFLSTCMMFMVNICTAQVVGLIAEEVENEGRVDGKTWRIYAEMTTVGPFVEACLVGRFGLSRSCR